jgi:hypothetical protein
MPVKKKAPKEPEESFSLVDHTASLDPFTLEKRIDAESSLYRWAQVVIGYENLPADCNYRLYEPIHRPMCDRVEAVLPIRGREARQTQRKLLDLEPRGSLKTHLETATAALYYLVFNYDGRELIGSHNHRAAKEILEIIKWNIEFNPTFKEFYGDWAYYAKKYGVWRDDMIRLAFRSSGLREPTIDTTGAEISKTGGHYDVIFIDDIQNRENVRSAPERANVRERFQEYFPQLEPNGGLIVPCTRYHRSDVYSWIMQRREAALKKPDVEPEWLFDVVVKRAWNEDGSLYYPTRLTEAFLGQQRDALEDYLFSVWYLNEPLEESAKVFPDPYSKQRDFDFVRGAMPYIEFPNGVRKSVYVTMSWDPKGRENPRRANDAHGISIIGTDSIGVWWTLATYELRLPLDALLDRICVLMRNFSVAKMSIETRGASTQGLYVDLLRPIREKHNLLDIPIVEWSPGTTKSKDTLIRSLQPRFKRGGWYFKKGYCDPILAQLDDFPQLENDDVLDSAVQQKAIARPAEPDDVVAGYEDEDEFDKGDSPIEQEMTDGAWVGLGTPASVA